MGNICCIFNCAALYRQTIYRKMIKELDCDFIVGDNPVALEVPVKMWDFAEEKKRCKTVKNKVFLKAPIYWQCGVLSAIFKPYNKYILTGELYCISTWIFLFMCKFMRSKKVFLWSHAMYGDEGYLSRKIKKLFFSLADGVFTYGNYAKKLLERENIDGGKIWPIYNSLDYDTQRKYMSELSEKKIYSEYFGNTDPVVIYIGRVTQRKYIDLLIKLVWTLNSKRGIAVNLVVVGDGDLISELKKLAKTLDIEKRIWFYGASYDEAKNCELLYNADLSITPGDVGLTAIHSMTYGCPVITHDRFYTQGPEFESIMAGETGDFYKHGDFDDLCAVTEKWLKKVGSNRESIREACFREIEERWNPDFQIKVFQEALKS